MLTPDREWWSTDPRRVAIWTVATSQPVPPEVTRLLAPAELTRLSDYRVPAAARRFAWARAALRYLLGRGLECAPQSVPLVARCRRCGRGAHGRPRVTRGAGPALSVTHATDVSLVALTARGPFGLDAEAIGDQPVSVPTSALTRRERDDLAADPPSIRSARELQLWVRKEAYSKAVGDGIELDFRALQVSPRAPAQHRVRAPGHPELNVFDLQVPGLATALATAQASPVVALHRFDWTSALASGQDKE